MKKFLLFFSMFLIFSFKVNALGHLELERIEGVFSSQVNLDNGSYFSSNQKKYIIDGRIVYCVEPGINIMTNDYDYSYNLYSSGFSQDIINKISLIGYFGYDYPGHHTDKYFLAAQELIWETIGNNEVHFTTGINDSGNIVNIDYEKNEIMSLVNHYYLKPSFDGSSVSGIYNNQIVLVDDNGVLSDFEVVSSNNSVSIDGNRLIIDVDALGDDRIVLSKKKYDDLASVFYYADNSQDFMLLRADDDFNSYLDVHSYIPYSNISIEKSGLIATGFDDDFIYEEEGLDNVIYELYAGSDIYVGNSLLYDSDQLIEVLTTNDGFVTSRDLPNGNYYLKEVGAPSEFLISNDKFFIELENYEEEVFTYMVSLKDDRKDVYISLKKSGEVFEEIVDSDSNFKIEPLSGVKFGLFSGDDIYSDNGLVVGKDILIKSFVTDDCGNVSIDINIPFGIYYIKELETIDGYLLDSNIYTFDVGNDLNSDVRIDLGEFINSIVKSNFNINKVDDHGNRLSNACFRLFDDSNDLIYEGCTNTDGVINISNLPHGKYYFYEVSAPDGYIVSDDIYNFSIVDDSSISFEVINVSMPITSDIYALPKKSSLVIIFLGFSVLSFTVLYDKKNKNN